MDESAPVQNLNPETPSTPFSAPTPKSTRRSLLWLLGIIVLFVACVATWFGYQKWQAARYAYIIPGVPTLNIYSGAVLEARVPPARIAELIAVMQYWGDPANLNDQQLVQNLEGLYSNTGVPDMVKMKQFFALRGLKVDNVTIQDTRGLENYINQKTPIPLFFSQVPDDTHLNLTYQTLLIGIDFGKKTITLNDFYRGQNYQMPISTFEHLWGLYPYLTSKYHYLAIYPLDPARIKARVAKNSTAAPYPTRTAPMDTLAPLMPTYALYSRYFSATSTADNTTKLGYIKALIESPLFSDLHPDIQVALYSQKGLVETTLGQYSQALTDIQKAISLDKNLDAPFAGWGQAPRPRIAAPYLSLVQYYKATGNSKGAADAAAQADLITKSFATSTVQ